MENTLLSIEDLVVRYNTSTGVVHAVNGITLDLKKGETLGLVGETGAGKTTIGFSILQLLPEDIGEIVRGKIFFNGEDLTEFSESEMEDIRGEKISMIFQDPMTSLNPIMPVEEQIAEAIELHNDQLSKHEVDDRVDQMLELVGIPKERKYEYPHQFSGGMKQRVIIAMALACDPQLLIADEPTTALDVTVQAQVLELMNELKSQLNTSLLLITHDLGVIAQMCDRVAVIYAGEIVEIGSLEDVYDDPDFKHPYTRGLFGAIPDLKSDEKRLRPVEGLMPDPMDLPTGCSFHPRCHHCMEICKTKKPPVIVRDGHAVMCHLFEEDHE